MSGGFEVVRAVEIRLMASLRWFEEQRRGMRRLICLSSSWVRLFLVPVQIEAMAEESVVEREEKQVWAHF